MTFDGLSKIILGLLWLATLSVALGWIFIPDRLPFEPEPLTIVLGLISAAVTALVREFRERLIREEYSTSYALAYGYVHNFLIPAIDKIEEQNPKAKVKIFIYMPEELKELESDQIKRTLRKVRQLGFSDQILNLELTKDRTRDLIVLSRSQQDPVYFDFPKTLLTLNSYVDYKLASKANHFEHPDKVKLGKKFIDLFEQHMREMLENNNMQSAISVVRKDLNFEGLAAE